MGRARTIIAVRPRHSQFHQLPRRRGTALLVVLVVIVLMTLGAYTFSELMIIERQASDRYGREAAARAFADSGIEMAAVYIADPPDEAGFEVNLYHNPELFGGVVVVDSEGDRNRGRFSIIAPVSDGDGGTEFRTGLMDESARLNLNAILGMGLDDTASRELLMYLPDMTEDIADAILDWIDGDEDPRLYGAESDAYLPAYAAANDSLESVDELLSVMGVTTDLLYGEDTNRNGLLDPNEDDGDASAPADNADGQLNPGWAAYLTVHSRETNLRIGGSAKIDVNQSLLTELFDEIEEEFGTDIAQFITAYRLKGSTNIEAIETLTEEEQALQEVAGETAKAIVGSVGGTVTRAGMDLAEGATFEFYSLFDLLDAEVEVAINEENTTLVSPWTSDPGDMTENLPALFEAFTVGEAEMIDGRINLFEGAYEVLLGLPDMPPDVAAAIVDRRPSGPDAAMAADMSRLTSGWLLINQLCDPLTLRKLDRYLTVRGDVYRVMSVGHFDRGGPLVRVEAVIDGTLDPPRIISQRDLTHLGPGYRLDQLSQLWAQ